MGDQVALVAAGVVEVELLQALPRGEPSGPDPALATVGLPGGDLALQQATRNSSWVQDFARARSANRGTASRSVGAFNARVRKVTSAVRSRLAVEEAALFRAVMTRTHPRCWCQGRCPDRPQGGVVPRRRLRSDRGTNLVPRDPQRLAIVLMPNPSARCSGGSQPSPPQTTTPFSSRARLSSRVSAKGVKIRPTLWGQLSAVADKPIVNCRPDLRFHGFPTSSAKPSVALSRRRWRVFSADRVTGGCLALSSTVCDRLSTSWARSIRPLTGTRCRRTLEVRFSARRGDSWHRMGSGRRANQV